MMPLGRRSSSTTSTPPGSRAAAITNRLVNFGWEYVYHCHILSHEEMDMMRPVSVAMPPNAAERARLLDQPGAASTSADTDMDRQLDR